jgi:hypothetical protein
MNAMWPFTVRKTFISHCSEDRDIAALIVELLRIADAAPFRAPNDLNYGAPFWSQLERAIDSARTVVVVWCRHASESEWVEKEWRYALERRKKVIAVLLDNTPLPVELSFRHSLDLRRSNLHGYMADFRELNSAKLLQTIGPLQRSLASGRFTTRLRLLGGYALLMALYRPFPMPSAMPDSVGMWINVGAGVLGLLILVVPEPLEAFFTRGTTWRQRRAAEEVLQKLIRESTHSDAA